VAQPYEAVIRRATLADAEAGARCHAACWREAYADIVAPVVLDALTADPAGRVAAWTRQLGRGDERWLALIGDEVVGFASAGDNRDDDLIGLMELYACYVRAAHQRRGLASRLLAAAIGDAPASLWVFATNERARWFYRRHGFVEDGSRKDDPRFGAEEIRMVRRGYAGAV